MPLAKEDLQQIEEHVKKHMADWLTEASLGKPPQVYEIELRERMVRVEEELKNQRSLILQFMEQTDKRFAESREDMLYRFEQIDKRFEQVDKRFEELREDMNARFEQVNKRFEQVDQRFDALTRRIDRFMVWSFGLTLTVGGLVVASLNFLLG